VALLALGVIAVSSASHDLKFRVRVKQAGDGVWRDATQLGVLDEFEARDALTHLGLSSERAAQLVDAARDVRQRLTIEADRGAPFLARHCPSAV